MTELTKMFTVVTPDEDEDGMTELLFYKGDGSFTEEEKCSIMSDTLMQELMGHHGILICACRGDNTEEMLVTRDISTQAVDLMDHARKDDSIVCYTPANGVESINLQQAYYGCKLPHRTILGCSTCLDREVTTACKVRALSDKILDGEDSQTPGEIVERLKSRKSKIAGFTYVSPRLTASEHFAKTYRDMNDHCFSGVEANSDIVRQGLRERGRAKKFAQNACPTCMVKDACGYEHNKKFCNGPYEGTEADAVKRILAGNPIPFTPKQLMFLALNSGELDKRVNRCIYWATFRTNYHGGLTFGLCRAATGHYQPFGSFKEAEKLLRAKLRYVREVPKKERLSPEMRALLLEASNWKFSPSYRAGWGTRQYDTLGLEYNHYMPGWQIRFKYNGNGCGGMLLPWSLTANKLTDIYKEYGNLQLLTKTTHPDSYKTVHNLSW